MYLCVLVKTKFITLIKLKNENFEPVFVKSQVVCDKNALRPETKPSDLKLRWDCTGYNYITSTILRFEITKESQL